MLRPFCFQAYGMALPFAVRIWLCTIFMTAGCSGDPNMAEVTGSVIVDGQPCKTGSIAFVPVDGNSEVIEAKIKDGIFSARVLFGLMKVEIRASKVVGEEKLNDAPDSPVQPITKEMLPACYNDQTKLTIEVSPGKNHKTFDLITK